MPALVQQAAAFHLVLAVPNQLLGCKGGVAPAECSCLLSIDFRPIWEMSCLQVTARSALLDLKRCCRCAFLQGWPWRLEHERENGQVGGF